MRGSWTKALTKAPFISWALFMLWLQLSSDCTHSRQYTTALSLEERRRRINIVVFNFLVGNITEDPFNMPFHFNEPREVTELQHDIKLQKSFINIKGTTWTQDHLPLLRRSRTLCLLHTMWRLFIAQEFGIWTSGSGSDVIWFILKNRATCALFSASPSSKRLIGLPVLAHLFRYLRT